MRGNTMKDGVYKAACRGFIDAVPVTVTIKDGRIEDVDVHSSNETEFFLMAPRLKIPPLIKKYQTLNIDTVTGATFCSRAILNGVADCVRQAGGDPEVMRRAPGPDSYPERVTEKTCDICVLGTGGSGTTAALTAAERGAKVIVLEKGNFIGGISACTNCIMTIGSRIQKRAGVEVDMGAMYDATMLWNHYLGDSRLISRFLHETGPLVDWLEDEGIQMEYRGKEQLTDPFDAVVHWAEFANMEAHRKNFQRLLDHLVELGGELVMEARGQSLIVENGKITGLRARLSDDSTLIIHAKAVVVATGGYTGNKELCKKMFTYQCHPWVPAWMAEGDGLLMCLDAGAATRDLGARVIHLSNPEKTRFDKLRAEGKIVPSALATFPSGMTVNYRGQRFMNEFLVHNSLAVANAYVTQNDYGAALSIFSEGFLDKLIEGDAAAVNLDVTPGGFMGRDYTTPGYFKTVKEDLEAYIECGLCVKADTPEELAVKLRMDDTSVLPAEIERYNAFCRAGRDDDFFKDPLYLHEMTGGPYYALRIATYGLGSLGGIMVDSDMKVLDKNHTPIPGLYAAGSCAGGMWGRDSYGMIEGCTCSWAFTTGRMAGIESAAYVLGDGKEQ